MLVESAFVKIRVFVPAEVAAAVREAIGKAGAGMVGNYDFCSASFLVTGRFRPLSGAKPAIGKVGEAESSSEDLIETICHKNKVKEVVQAIKKVHPYEEPMIDIMPRLEIE